MQKIATQTASFVILAVSLLYIAGSVPMLLGSLLLGPPSALHAGIAGSIFGIGGVLLYRQFGNGNALHIAKRGTALWSVSGIILECHPLLLLPHHLRHWTQTVFCSCALVLFAGILLASAFMGDNALSRLCPVNRRATQM